MRSVFALVATGSLLLLGCGRLNYDEVTISSGADAGTEGELISNGGLTDPGTALRACRTGTRRLEPAPTSATSSFCIDIEETGHASWVDGMDMCALEGKTLCTGAQWDQACEEVGTELVGMMPTTGWEWVLEVDGTSGHKRNGCGVNGTHDIDSDPYNIRCCSQPI